MEVILSTHEHFRGYDYCSPLSRVSESGYIQRSVISGFYLYLYGQLPSLEASLTIPLKPSGSRPQDQATMPRLPKLIMHFGASSQISTLSIFRTFQILLLVALSTNIIAAALPSSDITTRPPLRPCARENAKESKLCLFPDPNNCHNFIQCVADGLGTIEYILPCPLAFNRQLEWTQDKKECVEPKGSTCHGFIQCLFDGFRSAFVYLVLWELTGDCWYGIRRDQYVIEGGFVTDGFQAEFIDAELEMCY